MRTPAELKRRSLISMVEAIRFKGFPHSYGRGAAELRTVWDRCLGDK